MCTMETKLVRGKNVLFSESGGSCSPLYWSKYGKRRENYYFEILLSKKMKENQLVEY